MTTNGYLDTHIRRSISWSESGTVYMTYMYEAQRATRGPASLIKGHRWWTCSICGFDFPQEEIVLIGGAPYCTRYGDAQEKMADLGRRSK